MAACLRCGAENPGAARFCTDCGASLGDSCPQCGQELPAEGRFCPHCGALARGAEETPTALKLATILFADVVSSTARAEQMDPEDVHLLMSDFFRAMVGEIEREGGTVDKFLGDAVMAVFGIPAAHEDDAVRAVRAGKRMLGRLDRWNADKDPARQIEIRLGINTGQVHAAGSPGRDLTVTGDAVNVAARLEQAAGVGEIVIGERTARPVRRYFHLHELEPLTLKGKSAPVAAWVVGDERGIVHPRGLPGLSAPLIGRNDELELLQTTLARVERDRSPQLVTLTGDAGVGKTRLVREFIDRVDRRARVVIGRCLPYGEGITLWPLNEILKSEAGILDTDPQTEALEKIEKLVDQAVAREFAPDPDRTTAALALTLGIELPDGALAGLDPREAYRELRHAWRAFLTSLAQETSLVVVVEDIHWAGDPMLDALDDLTQGAQGPILFLCPARPDLFKIRPDWGGGRRNFSSLALDPLSVADGDALIASLLDADLLADETRAAILERAEGNPFFMEEIIHRLMDEGQLVHDDGGWRAVETITIGEIPDNVQAVIASRLDLLTPLEKEVIQHAAVVGRVFWEGAIEHLCGVGELEQIMTTLQRRELVEPRVSSSMAGQAEYSFKHILIREVAYESLPRAVRSRIHATVAGWLESSTGETGERAELLAYHYNDAYSFLKQDDLRLKAREYCLIAAQNAVRRFAFSDAEDLASRAIELSSPGLERLEALEARAHVGFRGQLAFESYRDAIAELKAIEPLDTRRLADLSSRAALLPTRWRGSVEERIPKEEVEGLISEGLQAAGPRDSPERAVLLACKAFVQLHYEEADHEGQAVAWAAVDMAERLGNPDLVSLALDALGSLLLPEGRYGELDEINERRLELIPRLTDVSEICDCYNMGAWAATMIGHYARAADLAAAAVERAKGIHGGAYWTAGGAYLQGLVWIVRARFMSGDWDGAMAAQAEIERLHETGRRREVVPMTVPAYGTAAFCAELRGDAARADRYLDDIRAFFEGQLPVGFSGLTWFVAPGIRALVHRGDLDTAYSWVNLERTPGRAQNLESLCEIAADRGDPELSRESISAARAEAEHGGLLALRYFADRLEGRTLSAADPARAEELLRRSAEGFGGLGAPWEAAWSRLLLAEVLIDHGRADDASPLQEAAGRTFESLGSVKEAARARELQVG